MYYYENQCGGCVYYDYQGDNSKGYCSWYRTYYYPGETCSHQKPREKSSGCYITTIVCNVLGLEDDCEVMQSLRGLRDCHLQNHEAGRIILLEYDVVGPEIAGLIEKEYKETGDKTLWQRIYDTYLTETSRLVLLGNYQKATEKYIEMVRNLKEYFAIPEHHIDIENYDQKNGGHGYIKKEV